MSNEINCLRCNKCALLPVTDLADRRAIIWCGKLETRREINLHGCEVADPHMRFGGAHGLAGHNPTHPDGNKTFRTSEAEAAFIAAHYATIPTLKTLSTLTGRGITTLRVFAKKHGLRRAPETETANRKTAMLAVRQSQRQSGSWPMMFTEAQGAWLMARYESGPWPSRGGNRYAERRAVNAALREEIVREVNARNAPGAPLRNWDSVQSYLAAQTPGRKRWREQYRRTGAKKAVR